MTEIVSDTAKLASHKRVIAEREQTIETLRAEIERLRAALEPFSWIPIGLRLDDPDEMQVYQCHGWPKLQWAAVTAADYRRARAAINPEISPDLDKIIDTVFSARAAIKQGERE